MCQPGSAGISHVPENKLHLTRINSLFCCWVQVPQRAAEKWKDTDAKARSLQLCVISSMLKVECCVNGTHSMDEVGLGAYGLYKTLPGLDCTFPGFVLQHCRHLVQQQTIILTINIIKLLFPTFTFLYIYIYYIYCIYLQIYLSIIFFLMQWL